jgi:hypothetical protein
VAEDAQGWGMISALGREDVRKTVEMTMKSEIDAEGVGVGPASNA